MSEWELLAQRGNSGGASGSGGGGGLLGEARSEATFSTSSNVAVDVPPLFVAFEVVDRPVKVSFNGGIYNTSAGHGGLLSLILKPADDLAAVDKALDVCATLCPTAGVSVRAHSEQTLHQLTPGIYLVRVQLARFNQGTVTLAGDPVTPVTLKVEKL